MFNFKLSERIGVFSQYTSGTNDCNAWKTEKHNECTNIAQLQTTQIVMAAVADVVKKAVFTNFRDASLLLDIMYIYGNISLNSF